MGFGPLDRILTGYGSTNASALDGYKTDPSRPPLFLIPLFSFLLNVRNYFKFSLYSSSFHLIATAMTTTYVTLLAVLYMVAGRVLCDWARGRDVDFLFFTGYFDPFIFIPMLCASFFTRTCVEVVKKFISHPFLGLRSSWNGFAPLRSAWRLLLIGLILSWLAPSAVAADGDTINKSKVVKKVKSLMDGNRFSRNGDSPNDVDEWITWLDVFKACCMGMEEYLDGESFDSFVDVNFVLPEVPSAAQIAMNVILFQLLILLTKGDPQKIVQKHMVSKRGNEALREVHDMILHQNVGSMGAARRKIDSLSLDTGEDPRT